MAARPTGTSPITTIPTPPSELQRQLAEATREVEALRKERERLSRRLEVEAAEKRAAIAARDAAVKLTVWGPPPRRVE